MNIQSQNCAPIQCTVWPRNGLNLAFEKSENGKVAPLHVESRRFLNSPWLRKSRLNFLVAKVWKLLRHNMGRKVLRKLRRQSASPVYQTHPQSLPSPPPNHWNHYSPPRSSIKHSLTQLEREGGGLGV